jgi:hypothetical protein
VCLSFFFTAFPERKRKKEKEKEKESKHQLPFEISGANKLKRREKKKVEK